MNKTLLADRIAERCGVSVSKAEKMLNVLIEEVIDETENGGKVELRRFGTFKLAPRKGRYRRNPQTGEATYVAPHVILIFKASKELRRQ